MASPIDSLRKAAARGMILRITCRQCQNVSNFMASDVMQFANPSKPIHDVKFVCDDCGARRPNVVAIEPDWDRDRGLTVWRPMKLK